MQCARSASARGCTENKGLLTDQAQPLSEASMSRQQAFATPHVNSHCFLLATVLRELDTRQICRPVLPEGSTFTGYTSYESGLRGSFNSDSWLTPAFVPHSPGLAKALQLAAQALNGKGHRSKCADLSSNTGWPGRHLHCAQHSF